ncbi:MAG TPA: M90 family metallopeptidase [Steroidobacteraceae bacterium]|nr:M90 family metallopeptidase [Steroidobacteraceae bacterium]
MSAAIAAIVVVACAVLVGLILPPLLRKRRRQRAFRASLPPSLRAAMQRNLPVVAVLPPVERKRLEGLVIAFLQEKQFVGCNGLEITDEIRATIAAQACLLLLGRRPGRVYDELQSILVYPGAFWVEDEVHDEDGLVTQRRRDLSGEAWDSHRIILSWEDVAESAQRPTEGYNVVLHEFAHHLDAEGLGLADTTREPAAWHAELVEEYEALRDDVEHGRETWLDPYGAENETEFFAVATEEFFGCPVELREVHPRLYALMRDFYGVDPARWTGAADRCAFTDRGT